MPPTEPGFAERLEAVIRRLAPCPRTRFAPAPTGYLHLGHVANAMVVWGVAAASGGEVILRIEDHDRQRCRPEFETALLDDIESLGFVPDEPSMAALRNAGSKSTYRQSDSDAVYAEAAGRLATDSLLYACDCSRSTFTDWAAKHGQAWTGPECPADCGSKGLSMTAPGLSWRVRLGDGCEPWSDLVRGPETGLVALRGDLPVRDRQGNWTYAFCVVVDDLRHGIDLVIRGEDLLDATPAQIRLGRVLGRAEPPRFLHHPLIRRPDGRKLSKSDGSTAVRSLIASGTAPDDVRAMARAAAL